VSWANDREISSIESGELNDAETFSGGDDRSVHGSQREIPIAGNKLCDPDPVARLNWFGDQVPGGEVAEEPHLGFDAETGLEQIGDLGNNELRNDERPLKTREQGQAGFVVAIVFVDIGVERAGIDDQRDRRASRRKISSIRRAVSRRPLRPALAAMRCRRPAPRWDSMASRVISETVVSRRSAS
jgi:hypothetical protein